MSSDQDRADARSDRAEDRADARSERDLFVLSRTKLWWILFMVWLMSNVTSAGVGFVFAGISTDRSNDALSKIVALQKTQGQKEVTILYNSTLKRCRASVGSRQIWIHDARIQARHNPGVLIPKPLTPCETSVQNPVPLPSHR